MIQFGGNIGAACEERIDIVWKSARRSTSEEMARQPDLDARSAAALSAADKVAPMAAADGPRHRHARTRLTASVPQTSMH